MDIFPTKHKAFIDGAAEGQGDRGIKLGGFSVSFEDILSKAGAHIGNSLNSLTNSNGIVKAMERVEKPVAPEKQNFERREDAPRAEQRDDYDREQHAERKEAQESGNNDRPHNNDSGSRGDSNHEAAPQSKDQEVSTKDQEVSTKDQEVSTSGSSTSTDNEGAEEVRTVTAETSQQNGENGTPAENINVDQAASAMGQADEVLAGLIAAAQSGVVADHVSEQASANGAENSQRVNAVEGLNTALNAVNSGKGVENGAEANVNGQQVKANAAGIQNNAQSHILGQGQDPEQLQAQTQSQAKIETAVNATAQQAAGLSKMVGDGNRIAVNVAVADASANVVSKPSTTLGASSVLAAEGAGQQQLGQQTPLNHGAAANLANAHGAPAQNQAQQASAQVQAASANGSEAKGPVQGVQVANAGGQQVQSVGGDSVLTAAPNASNETSQTLKNTATQANNAHQANVPKQAVVDQVSVQITKAIKAGMDKINIQLRPADLGRVDVRLEVGHDGRTQAIVTADNKNTLELLQRNSQELARALQEAGLQMNNDGLSFSLRGQDGQGGDNEQNATGSSTGNENDQDADELADEALMGAYDGGIIEDDRIDVRA